MNFTIEKIIVPLDLSENSLNALDTAVALSKKHKATLIVLNIIEPKFSISESFYNTNALSNSKDILNALVGKIQDIHEIRAELIQGEGIVFEQIIRFSITEHANLIVMGTHGASGYREGFLGSNIYAVMKHSFIPVLSIPPRKKYNSFKNIVFPVRPVAGALSKYNILCHFLNSQSTIEVLGLSLHKMERETNVLVKIVDEIKDQALRDKVKINIRWGNGDGISEDILEYIHKTPSDLIVITNALDVTTKAGFLGPHSQRIINCSKVPILNIKTVGTPYYA